MESSAAVVCHASNVVACGPKLSPRRPLTLPLLRIDRDCTQGRRRLVFFTRRRRCHPLQTMFHPSSIHPFIVLSASALLLRRATTTPSLASAPIQRRRRGACGRLDTFAFRTWHSLLLGRAPPTNADRCDHWPASNRGCMSNDPVQRVACSVCFLCCRTGTPTAHYSLCEQIASSSTVEFARPPFLDPYHATPTIRLAAA